MSLKDIVLCVAMVGLPSLHQHYKLLEQGGEQDPGEEGRILQTLMAKLGCFHCSCIWVILMKLDGVGPIDNRPSTD